MNANLTRRYTRFHLCLISTLLLPLSLSAWAQVPAAAPTPDPDLARAQQMLSQEQAKVKALEQELLALDKEIDGQVEGLVQRLKTSEDSTPSKTQVMNTKKEALASLDKWVKEYTRERGKRMGDLQQTRSAAGQAELQGQIEAIDAGLNRRVDQMVELAASMSTSEELKRYDTYRQDWGIAKVETEDYRVNQRQISYANQAQEELGKNIEQAIQALENDIALVPQRFPLDQQEAELARLNSLLDARNDDLRQLATAYPEKATAVGKSGADRLAKQLHYTQEDIRAKWAQLLAQANTLSVERQRVRQLEARVKAMETQTAPPAAAPVPAPAP